MRCRLRDSEGMLQVYGAHRVMENAAVALAVAEMTGGRGELRNGYMAHLVGGAHIVPGAGGDVAEAVADIAMNADTQLLRYSVDRPDLRMLFTATRGHYEILARRSAGISRPADLRGKRIGTFPRTSSEYFLMTELAAYGVPVDEVEIVPLVPEMAVADALVDGEVDAITIWEPAMQFAKESIGDDAVRLVRPGAYFLRLNVNTTAAALADPVRRAQIVDFTRHVIRASERVRCDPDAAARTLSAMSGFDAGLVRRSLHTLEFVASLEEDALDVLVAQEEWVAREQERPPRSRLQLAPLIDTSVYAEAVAGLAATDMR